MRKEKSCGAVVYKTEQSIRYYLIEYMKKGHVSIPKGHVENNETEEETALREIKEETNLDVKLNTSFRHSICYSPEEGVMKDVIFFLATPISQRLINQECEVSALDWLPFEKALAALTFESDKETLSLAEEFISRNIPPSQNE